MIRFLAHRVILDEVPYPLSVVTVHDTGEVDIEPFAEELHSTRFVDGTVSITTRRGQLPLILADGRPISFPQFKQ